MRLRDLLMSRRSLYAWDRSHSQSGLSSVRRKRLLPAMHLPYLPRISLTVVGHFLEEENYVDLIIHKIKHLLQVLSREEIFFLVNFGEKNKKESSDIREIRVGINHKKWPGTQCEYSITLHQVR